MMKIPDRLVTFLKILLWLALTVLVAVQFIRLLTSDRGAFDVIALGFYLLGALYLWGLATSFLWSGTIAAGLTDFMLYPRRFLKAPPVILSRPQGLIASGKYEQAERELARLRAENPASPELSLMLIEFHAFTLGDAESALKDCEFYFRHRKLRPHELNRSIVLHYVDLLELCGRAPEAAEFLREESRRLFLSPQEKRSFGVRAAALTRGQQRPE